MESSTSYLCAAASLPPSCCFSLEHPPNSASWSAGKNVGSREWFRTWSWVLLLRSCSMQCLCVRNEVEATGNRKKVLL